MFRRCRYCGYRYSYNPSIGDRGLICPHCNRYQNSKERENKSMKKHYKYILMIISTAALFLACFTQMSTRITAGESCIMTIRGYNLAELTPWAGILIFAPLFAAFIIISSQPAALKQAEIIFLTVMYVVCYIHSMNTARDWLWEIGGSRIITDIGMYILPLGYIAVILTAKFFTLVSSKNKVGFPLLESKENIC